MTIPLMLISILGDGKFHSEKKLANQLGVNRLKINKHIKTLESWGKQIFYMSGQGYRLSEPIQFLNGNFIRNKIGNNRISILPVLDSTNQYLLDRIDELHSGDTCVAEYQESGRGRRGRKWFSPFGTNLCFSMFWRLKQGPSAAIGINLAIGVAMAEVLRGLGANSIRVKWPNDLYFKDRKLAGILVELSGKTENATRIVIGAGINIVTNNVQADIIKQAWVSLKETGTSLDRNILTVCLIKKLRNTLSLFEREGLTPFLSQWKKFDNFINRPVKLIIGDKEIYGIARGINTKGALLVEQDKIVKAWSDGEASLRSAE